MHIIQIRNNFQYYSYVVKKGTLKHIHDIDDICDYYFHF